MKSEVGSRNSELGSRNSELGSRKLEVGTNNYNNNFILNYPFTTVAHTVGVAAVHQNLYTYIYMQIKGNQIFKKHCVYSAIV